MTKVTYFTFTNKSNFSTSGTCIQVSTKNTNENFQLFRQFEGSEKVMLTKFNLNNPSNKLIKFDINTKIRDVYRLIETTKESLNKTNPLEEDKLSEKEKEILKQKEILKLWQENFNSEEFIQDSYNGYMFMDLEKRLWIYDIVPASREHTQVNNENPLPLPGTSITYSIISEESKEEVFYKEVMMPEFLPDNMELMDIFKHDIYIYHIGLYNKNKCMWGIFTDKSSKRSSKVIKSDVQIRKSFLCKIKPDINLYPNFNIETNLFKFLEHPPSTSYSNIMQSTLRVVRIKTDTGDPNNFNILNIETKYFNPADFPRTFPLIFPYK